MQQFFQHEMVKVGQYRTQLLFSLNGVRNMCCFSQQTIAGQAPSKDADSEVDTARVLSEREQGLSILACFQSTYIPSKHLEVPLIQACLLLLSFP